MAQITEWLKPYDTYTHKTQGKKENITFLREIVNDVNRDPKRHAKIISNGQGGVAVYTERR